MGYTTVPVKAANSILTSTEWNSLVGDNMAYMLNGKQTVIQRYNKAGGIAARTGAGSNAWADVDGGAVILNIPSTFLTGRLLVGCSFGLEVSNTDANATKPYMVATDIVLDSTGVYLSSGTTTPNEGQWYATNQVTAGEYTTDFKQIMTISGLFVGIAAGVHTLKLQWKNNVIAANAKITANSTAINGEKSYINFWAAEF